MSSPPRKPRIVVGPASGSAATREKLVALLLLLAIVIASISLTYTRTVAGNKGARDLVDQLTAERDAVQRQFDSVRQQLAVAQRGDQVTRDANDQLRDDFVALQDEMAGLRSDIEFYQRLLGASGAGTGLAVHGLHLEHTASPLVYRFELTLSQNMKKAQIVAGRAELFIDGVEDDGARTLDLVSMNMRDADGELGFEFKYFQLLRGSFVLPEGFVAERLRVRLVVRGGRTGKPLWREFNWSELIEPDIDPAEKDRVQQRES